jgi:hypothetical protein
MFQSGPLVAQGGLRTVFLAGDYFRCSVTGVSVKLQRAPRSATFRRFQSQSTPEKASTFGSVQFGTLERVRRFARREG